MAELVEPTPDEARNGWTAETLAAYRAEREAASNRRVLAPRPRQVRVESAWRDFDPWKW